MKMKMVIKMKMTMTMKMVMVDDECRSGQVGTRIGGSSPGRTCFFS